MASNQNSDKTPQIEYEYITGVQPVDIYGNLNKRGFNTKASYGDIGNSWTSVKEVNGITLRCEIFGKGQK